MKTNSTIKSLVSAALLALPFALLGGCSSGGSGGVAPTTSTTTPGYTIKAVGANGGLNGANGGGGGSIYIDKDLGSNDISVSKTGTANASFTTTAYTADLGTNPVSVTANTTITPTAVTLNDYTVTTTDTATGASSVLTSGNDGVASCAAGNALTAGTPYTVANDPNGENAYISDGSSSATCPATVSAGTYYISGTGAARSLYVASGSSAAADAVAPAGTVYMDGTGVASSAYASDGDNTVADAILPAGTPYIIGRPYNFGYDANLYISDADNTAADTYATGLSVASGVTLTLGTNYNGREAILYFQNDVSNAGTITTVDAPNITNTRGYLEIDSNVYVGKSGSAITLAGTSTAINGGELWLYPNEFLNAGTIDTSGAASATASGGNAGQINILPYFITENTGAITANGGASTFATGNGGNSGYIGIWNYYGHLYNSGAINSNGGAGVAAGGIAYGADLGENNYAYNSDTVINSGNISAVGGSASAGNGGPGAWYEIGMYAAGSPLINSGNLIATGGATTDTASTGGYGGYVYLDGMSGTSGNWGTYMPAGPVTISGNIDTSAGASVASAASTGNGAGGGYVDIIAADDRTSYAQAAQGTDGALQLLGYSSLDAHAGSGNYPGSGGYVEVWAYSNYVGGVPIAGASVTNEADINTSGGSVPSGAVVTTAAYGGYGGDAYVGQDNYGTSQLFPKGMMTSNSGTITASAGASLGLTGYGHWGGYLNLQGGNGLTNTGAITSNGSSDASTAGGTVGYGGYGGYADLENDFNTLSNSGALAVNGGDGAYAADSGGSVYLYSSGTVVGSGSIAANGGNADATLAGSTGGYGGDVYIYSYTTPSKQTGAVSVAGGTGTTPGTAGYYYKQ